MISKRFQGIKNEVQTSIMIYDPLSIESKTIVWNYLLKRRILLP